MFRVRLTRVGAGGQSHQPHLPHKPHNPLAVDRVSLLLEPDGHPPAAVKRRVKILPVNQFHQPFVFLAFQPGLQRGVVPGPAHTKEFALTPQTHSHVIPFLIYNKQV